MSESNNQINYVLHDHRACGLLPDMILDGDGDIEDHLVQNYPFFFGWSEPNGATVVNGVWKYPGDKPLKPVGQFIQGNKTIYIYPAAIVAVLENGRLTKWTRCD